MSDRTFGLTNPELRAAGIAYAACAVVPAIYFALSSPGVGSYIGAPIRVIVFWFLVFYLFSLGLGGIFALPAFVFLQRRQLVSVPVAVVSGAISGALVSVLVVGVSNGEGVLHALPVMCALGAISGLIFGLLWRVFGGEKHES